MNFIKSSIGLIIVVILFGLLWWLVGEKIVKNDKSFRSEAKIISSYAIINVSDINVLEKFYSDTLKFDLEREDTLLTIYKAGIKFVKNSKVFDTTSIEINILNWNEYYRGIADIKPNLFKNKYIQSKIKIIDPAGNKLILRRY